MTLILIWPHEGEISVIADTRFTARGPQVLDIGPKIFSVPITVHTGDGQAPQHLAPMGFAFAGCTSAGQVTHAAATAGLQGLRHLEGPKEPSVTQVAAFYRCCAVAVVEEFYSMGASNPTFEAVIFGHEKGTSVAYSLELGLDLDGNVVAVQELYDFAKHGLYAIGQGAERVQAHIDSEWAAGRRSTVYEALAAVIRDEEIPSVGGSIQCALTGPYGVELKAVLRVDDEGLASGGYMGLDISRIGLVGELVPFGSGPVVLKPKLN